MPVAARNLITPVPAASYGGAAAQPVNSEQIRDLITDTDDRNMIFYEYEIVNRDREAEWADRQARRYGLCVCSRFIFLLLGNLVLAVLTCSACAILLYVNTPINVTYQPLTLGESCVQLTGECDSLRWLTCTAGTCACLSNRVWNGTDCMCTKNQYWDGVACMTSQGYLQPCWQSGMNCYSLFTCDWRTGTCLCPSSSNSFYSQFYTGSIFDMYGTLGGYCTNKYTYGVGCALFGFAACQDYLGLTCAVGPTTAIQCVCYSGSFWNSSRCQAQIQTEGGLCLYNQWNACSASLGLYCNTATWLCACRADSYWNTINSVCTVKGGYRGFCLQDTWCNTTLGLSCYLGAGAACNCPTASTVNYCDCQATMYWDGTKCTARVTLNTPCPFQNACATGICIYGFCL